MLAYFLFLFYLVCGTAITHWLIRRWIFPFRIYHTVSLVLFKVLMGCLYGWLFYHYYGGDDTWRYFSESEKETRILLTHPALFFREFNPQFSFDLSHHQVGEALIFYINNFERWFLIKGLAILNLFSGKNYYINVLLFEFLVIPGPLLLFKLLASRFPMKSGMYFILVFFIPSVTFWCSGIRAESLLLLGMVLMIYNGDAYTLNRGAGKIAGIVAGLVLLLLIRYQFLLIFFPFFIIYWISTFRHKTSPVYFNRFLIAAALLFAASLFLPEQQQLSRPIIRAQQGFMVLEGNTRYRLDTLRPGPVSFLRVLPQAIRNSIFRPYPWEGKHLMQSVSSIDVLFLVAGLLFFLLSRNSRRDSAHPLYWLFLYYSVVQLVFIGYVVPFPGAIVRYRTISFFLLFLFLYSGNPMVQQKLRYWIFKLH